MSRETLKKSTWSFVSIHTIVDVPGEISLSSECIGEDCWSDYGGDITNPSR